MADNTKPPFGFQPLTNRPKSPDGYPTYADYQKSWATIPAIPNEQWWETQIEADKRRRTSPDTYLATPPVQVKSFVCFKEASEVIGGKTYCVPAFCSSVTRHECGFQLSGHDFGDEDKVP